MSKFRDSEAERSQRIARACVVAEFGPDGVGVIEYLRRCKA